VARKDAPDEERRMVEEVAATTYSTETGETKEEAAPERPAARRRPRKRRPRPEVIAQIKGGEDEAADSGDEEAEA